ncbi:MAG: DUF4097 family beta strand repeat protein [Planctomycetes bacterium]|nr:DUF4097 family beta strand repeat protein [Planctomycetota bacterium]
MPSMRLALAGSLATLLAACSHHSYVGRGNFDPSTAVHREEERALELGSAELLDLEIPAGAVSMHVSAGAPQLRAKLTVLAETKAEAERALAACELVVERRPDGLAIRLREPEGNLLGERPWYASAHLHLYVPSGTRGELATGSGDLEVSGACGDLRLRSSYGALRVRGARGKLSATTSSGSIEVAEVQGDEVTLESSYGAIALREIRAPRLSATTSSGDIEARGLQGESVDLLTSCGAIDVHSSTGRISAASGSGGLNLLDVRGAVEARSSYGAITIDGVFTALVARTDSGDIDVRARAESTVNSAWELGSSFGRVRLVAPANFACELEAETSHGALKIGFPLTIDAGALDSGSRRVRGKIGGGGPAVRLASASGDVILERQ